MTIKVFIRILPVLFLLWTMATDVAKADEAMEYKVKAAFLLNFAKFTTWPSFAWADNETVFLLTVLGDDPFGGVLRDVEQKEVGGRRVRLQALTAGDGCAHCQLLFICRSEEKRLPRILAGIAQKPVVTVSDIEGFASAGGIFELRNKDGRQAFIVNNSKARESGIQISSSLLNLAIEVL